MRGFLSLEPDETTHARLVIVQNRLRDALTRQGVSFPERLNIPLLAWPFASLSELSEAFDRLDAMVPTVDAEPLRGAPHDDRPAEVGFTLVGLEGFRAHLFGLLRETLDPDPPKATFLRLARVSPPSRKIGVALRGSGALGTPLAGFSPAALGIWHQTAQGYELYRTMRVDHGGA